MGGRPGHNRRRSTRNKTIVFDASTLLQDDESQQALLADNITVIMNPDSADSKIDYRSHCFKDLLNAFHSIEKRVDKDPAFVSEALKRFKTNDDFAVDADQTNVQEMIRLDLFPKIRNNPFLRNESEIPVRKIEKNFNYSQSQGNKYNNKYN